MEGSSMAVGVGSSSSSSTTSASAHTSPSHSRAPSSIPMRNSNLGLNQNQIVGQDQNQINSYQPNSSMQSQSTYCASNSSLSIPILPSTPLDSSSSHSYSQSQLPTTPTQSTSIPIPTTTSTSTSTSQEPYSTSLIPINHFSSPNLRSDLILLIGQWLNDEGFGATRLMLLDEANVKNREREELKADNKKLRKALMEGDFGEIDKLLGKGIIKHQKAFKYSVYKQQYLELIEQREFQKAFTFLNKRLKPLEHYQPNSTEFQNLCYLLTAKSVTDAPAFRAWEGIQPAREKLVSEYDAILSMERAEKEGGIPNESTKSTSSSTMLGGMRGNQDDLSNNGEDDGNLEGFENLGLAGGRGEEGTGNGKGKGNGEGNLRTNPNENSKESFNRHQQDLNRGNYVPPHRLITLLSQSLTHQLQSARYKAQKTPVIDSLMWDWRAMVVPDFNQRTMRGHRRNVKCLSFVGESGEFLVSGSSDNTVRIWSVSNNPHRRPVSTLPATSASTSASTLPNSSASSCVSVLTGHASRVWSVDSTRNGEFIASGSGDGTIRIWKTDATTENQAQAVLAPSSILEGSAKGRDDVNGINGSYLDSIRSGDIYTCKFLPNGVSLKRGKLQNRFDSWFGFSKHRSSFPFSGSLFSSVLPLQNQAVAGGYDRIIRMYDIETSSCTRTFTGHQGAVSSVAINPSGTFMVSASKDSTIKVWDLIGGNVKTLETHLGEVTSIAINESGTLLLSNSKDNSCRIIDFRMLKPLKRLTGHSNTNKNFVRSTFLHSNLIASGSEDGLVYLWNAENGELIQSLKGHGIANKENGNRNGGSQVAQQEESSGSTTVYEPVWNRNKNLLASCSDDGTVRTWVNSNQEHS